MKFSYHINTEKRPLSPGWQQEELDTGKVFATLAGGYNIGVKTGQKHGLGVVDIDIDKGAVADGLDLPPTWTMITGGGRHLYYSIDRPFKNSANHIAEYVDTRGDGGQVVGVGSIHPEKGTQYRWADGLSPNDVPLAAMPKWVYETLAKPKPKWDKPPPPPPLPPKAAKPKEAPPNIKDYQRAADKALVDIVTSVANLPEGERNDGLNRGAFDAGQLVGLDLLDRGEVDVALFNAALAIGLGAGEAKATIKSGLDNGIEQKDSKLARIQASIEKRKASKPRPKVQAPPQMSQEPQNWPAPTPLPKTPPVAEFDLELLPRALHEWIEDASERFQCPPDYLATGALVQCGALLGRRLGILPKARDTGWTVVPNLWGAVVGAPGTLKSPALHEATTVIRRLDANAHEANTVATRDYERAMREHKKESRKSPESEPPERPALKRWLVYDCTVEKLQEILVDNPAGVLQFRDELTGFLRNCEKPGRESDRAFFLESWAGLHGFTCDRIGRGTTYIPSVCLSLLGGLQPGPLNTYAQEACGNGEGADGLLQRFQLLVWPEPPPEWHIVDREPHIAARERAFSAMARLSAVTGATAGAEREEHGVPCGRLDAVGQAVFFEWLEAHEGRLASMRAKDESEALVAHLAKYRSLIPSLALIFELLDSGCGPVGETATLRACAWAVYLESHARKVYANVAESEATHAAKLLARIQRGDIAIPFTARNVKRKHWAGLKGDAVDTALDLLEEHAYLRRQAVETGGKSRVEYTLNPRAGA